MNAILGLRELADLYEATMKVRNACANRLGAVERGADDADEVIDVSEYPLLARMDESLEQAKADMELAIPSHPVYDWLMGVPGINRTLACRILGGIPMESESDFTTFSKFRVFSGLCPGRNKLVKGEKACFSKRMKVVLYVAWGNMLKAEPATRGKEWSPTNFYAEIYRKWRVIYEERHGTGAAAKEAGWPKLRQSYASKNKMLDVFCCHLWREWRENLGWDVRTLYVHEVLGHHMNYESSDFSSEAMAERKIKKHRRLVAV